MCTDGDDEPMIVGTTGLVMFDTVLVEDVLLDAVVQRMSVLENDISKSGHILTSGGMETEARPRSRHKARENVHARATIGFGFTSDWSKKWRENFEPITE